MASLKNIGVLLSGRGSNFMAIAESVRTGKIPARIAVVISNRSDAPGIEHARKLGLDARVILSRGMVREEHDRLVASALRECEVELVCLAGYMRLLSPVLINAFPQRILNIHPSLLPAFPGLDAQKQAVEYGVKVSGCTVHFVDEHLDHGAIVVQKTVPLHEADDDHSLAARILEQEHIAYTEAINIVLSGEYEISGRRVIVKRSQMAKAT
ncbi:MAG TPA: phosphoribosylglycinamide formyltransferase [Terriglobales bacterium]|nr:phosphoribosylglycinamide formyltransferase [Terriglobales bacterium]